MDEDRLDGTGEWGMSGVTTNDLGVRAASAARFARRIESNRGRRVVGSRHHAMRWTTSWPPGKDGSESLHVETPFPTPSTPLQSLQLGRIGGSETGSVCPSTSTCCLAISLDILGISLHGLEGILDDLFFTA